MSKCHDQTEQEKWWGLLGEGDLLGKACRRPFPIEHYCAMESSRLWGVHNGAGYSGNIWYVVQMPESKGISLVLRVYVNFGYQEVLTLIASVRIAAITSSEPPRTRLSERVGSYSQIAVEFSTAAIFVMWDITSTFLRFITCPKQLCTGGFFRRRKSQTTNKCTVIAVHHYSTGEGLSERGYPG